jgi:hypothetical protein
MMAEAHTQTLGAGAAPLLSQDATQVERIELLLGRCAQRDERALQELYQLVSGQLLGILMRILRRRAVAEEALQDVMVKIWERADQYVAYRGRAMAWITAIARWTTSRPPTSSTPRLPRACARRSTTASAGSRLSSAAVSSSRMSTVIPRTRSPARLRVRWVRSRAGCAAAWPV